MLTYVNMTFVVRFKPLAESQCETPNRAREEASNHLDACSNASLRAWFGKKSCTSH